MCYPCMKDEHAQYMLELRNAYASKRIVTLYHEGFTAAQISEIIGPLFDLDYIELMIERHA